MILRQGMALALTAPTGRGAIDAPMLIRRLNKFPLLARQIRTHPIFSHATEAVTFAGAFTMRLLIGAGIGTSFSKLVSIRCPALLQKRCFILRIVGRLICPAPGLHAFCVRSQPGLIARTALLSMRFTPCTILRTTFFKVRSTIGPTFGVLFFSIGGMPRAAFSALFFKMSGAIGQRPRISASPLFWRHVFFHGDNNLLLGCPVGE